MKLNFSDLVEEAQREPVIIDMPEGDPIIVQFPDGDRAKEIAQATQYGGTDDDMIKAIFGDDAAKRLLKAFRTAPADVPGRLAQKVMRDWGIPLGNGSGRDSASPASSIS